MKTKHQPIWKDPRDTLTRGFHIHLDFIDEQETLALAIFDRFLSYLLSEDLRPTSTRLYAPGENGPHVQRGWEVKFETRDPRILDRIGIAIAWLMCNRQNLSVFIHAVSWEEGDIAEELKAHERYSFSLGNSPELNLNFFSDQLDNDII